jgi:hypothetical protein
MAVELHVYWISLRAVVVSEAASEVENSAPSELKGMIPDGFGRNNQRETASMGCGERVEGRWILAAGTGGSAHTCPAVPGERAVEIPQLMGFPRLADRLQHRPNHIGT